MPAGALHLRHASRLPVLGLLLGLAVIAADASAAGCDTCAVDVNPAIPAAAAVGQVLKVVGIVTVPFPPECTDWQMRFNDGTNPWAGTIITPGTPIWHSWDEPGVFTWKVYLTFGYGEVCVKEGTITITEPQPCTLTCSATVPGGARKGETVTFTASSTVTGQCTNSNVCYLWDFGDGTPVVQTTEASVTHAYASNGAKPWTMTAKLGCELEEKTCPQSGTLQVSDCLTIGGVQLCGDSWSVSGSSYTATGNVRLNNSAVTFSAPATYTGDPALGTGALSTTGNTVALLSPTPRTLLFGPTTFALDGNAWTLTPQLPDLTTLPDTLAGIPLYNPESSLWTIGGNWVRLSPRFYVGDRSGQPLASINSDLVYTSGGARTMLNPFAIHQGALLPGVTLDSFAAALTAGDTRLTGTGGLVFPSLNATALPVAFESSSCVDTLKSASEWNSGYAIGSGAFSMNKFTVEQRVRCGSAPGWTELQVGPDGFLQAPAWPTSFFSFDPNLAAGETKVRLRFEAASRLTFRQTRTLRIFLIPQQNLLSDGYLDAAVGMLYAKGTVYAYAGSHGSMSGIWHLGLFPEKNRLLGWFWGRVVLTHAPVQTPRNKVEEALIKAVVGNLPYVVTLPMDVSAEDPELPDWRGILRGTASRSLVDFDIKVELTPGQLGAPEITYTVGVDLIPLAPPVTRSLAAPVEASVTLTAPRDELVLGAVGGSATPDVYLENPGGQTITPATVGAFPGVIHFSDSQTRAAGFFVDAAAAGTWTLGVTNLPGSDLQWVGIADHPVPQVAFTDVHTTLPTVSMTVSVAPASADTKVSLFWSRYADGMVEGDIATGLPATTGGVQAIWSTTGLPPGTYYLIARTEDGVSVPVTTLYGSPIVLGSATLAAPTALAGTRTGATASLTWTRSASPGIVGTQVRYTDEPDRPGYPYVRSVGNVAAAEVTDLDETKEYRFAVAGFTATGQSTPESNPWTTSVAPPETAMVLANGVAVSDAVTAGAFRFYRLDVPAGAATLDVTTLAASANVDLYLKKGEMPDTSDYHDHAATPSGNETVHVERDSTPQPLASGSWYIGVYGAQSATYALTASLAVGLPGDASGDGSVDVQDVFYLINFLFAGGPAPAGPADTNGDSAVNVQDVFYLINYLFAGGPAPV